MHDEPAWDTTVAALNDANVAVNTVDADGLGGPRRLGGSGGILSMQLIARQTGGQAFFHRNDLDAAIAEGIWKLSGYTLGFYLGDLDGKYHKLKVSVDRPGLTLDYRSGYYAQTDAMHDLANKKSELESFLLAPLDLTGVGITASVEINGGALKVNLRLSPESLTLEKDSRMWKGTIEELFLEKNDAGGELARVGQKDAVPSAARRQIGFRLPRRPPVTIDALCPRRNEALDRCKGLGKRRTGSLAVPLKP
jgi:hypothetical protein